MRFVNEIAARYLFSAKGTHFINIISGVTILGLSLGSAALILVMSVFNGFEELIGSMINQFNPELKIQPATGKYLAENDELIQKVVDLEEVLAVTKVIEETAAFEYQKYSNVGTLVGVDEHFRNVTDIDSTMIEGEYKLYNEEYSFAVLGAGMARNLSVDVLNAFESLNVHMSDRKTAASVKPFRTRIVRPIGVFSIQQDIDNEIIIVPFDFAQSLLDRRGQVSYLGLRLQDDVDVDAVQARVSQIFGKDVVIRNRYQQDEDFLKLMNIEKYMASLIASLMLVLIAFNLIGCLWMIILDKKKDIAILKAMGSTSDTVRKIFLRLGLFYTVLGLVLGIALAVVLYIAQKEFGLVTIGQGFVVDAYPIRMLGKDVLMVAIIVIIIGYVASLPAAAKASKLSTSIREI